ncbi:MAG: hypothetical protein ABSA47_03885 [Verrucomicrobiota bacterium]
MTNIRSCDTVLPVNEPCPPNQGGYRVLATWRLCVEEAAIPIKVNQGKSRLIKVNLTKKYPPPHHQKGRIPVFVAQTSKSNVSRVSQPACGTPIRKSAAQQVLETCATIGVSLPLRVIAKK